MLIGNTCVNCGSCGIYIIHVHECVSAHEHNWQIHNSIVSEILLH